MLMKADKITTCYLGPQISPEQFITEHFFLFLTAGSLQGYDGNKYYTLTPGDSCLVRKNHLARYNKLTDNGRFEKTVVVFDEAFLRAFSDKHPVSFSRTANPDAFIRFGSNESISGFVPSLTSCFDAEGRPDAAMADEKREELLLLLLQLQPDLADTFFDFAMPEKINLEAYMNRHFRFNVAIQRFAYLTGRSLTSFKRDFNKLFNESPGKWLVQKRLQEAYFLMDKKGMRASDVYLEVGFEDLSHFSFAFKKQFGFPPTHLTMRKV